MHALQVAPRHQEKHSIAITCYVRTPPSSFPSTGLRGRVPMTAHPKRRAVARTVPGLDSRVKPNTELGLSCQ